MTYAQHFSKLEKPKSTKDSGTELSHEDLFALLHYKQEKHKRVVDFTGYKSMLMQEYYYKMHGI